MKTRFRGFLLGVVVGFIGISVAGTLITKNLALDSSYTYIRLFNEVLQLVRNSYVDETQPESLMKGAYEGLVGELDPFSEYLTPQEYADQVHWNEGGATEGGRADVGLRLAKKEGIVVVISVKPGSDSAEKGITPGDQIRRIGDRSVREMTLRQVEALLSGPPGTKVAVSVARREEPHKLDTDLVCRTAPAGEIALQIADADRGIAVLTLPQLLPGATEKIASALERAQKNKVKRLLIDLRGNAWGTIDEAVKAAGLFVGPTVVAGLKSRQGTPAEIKSEATRAAYDGDVAVLLNGATAEAAELLAAALHDGRAAKVLGETSFGVGAQQEMIPLKNGAYLKLSVRKYQSPSGTAWHGVGLKPDIPVTAMGHDLTPAQRLAEQLKLAIEQVRGLPEHGRA